MDDKAVERIVAEALSAAKVNQWDASAYFKKFSVYEDYARAVVAALRKQGLLKGSE